MTSDVEAYTSFLRGSEATPRLEPTKFISEKVAYTWNSLANSESVLDPASSLRSREATSRLEATSSLLDPKSTCLRQSDFGSSLEQPYRYLLYGIRDTP
jgi:hypothetical protein